MLHQQAPQRTSRPVHQQTSQQVNSHPDGTCLLCDCCQPRRRQKLGIIYPQHGILLVDNRHGTLHRTAIGARELLTRLAGTMDGGAIMRYVESVVG